MSPGEKAYRTYVRLREYSGFELPWEELLPEVREAWEAVADEARRDALEDSGAAEAMGLATTFQLLWRQARRAGGTLDDIAIGKDPDSGREYTAEELRALARKALGKP